MQRKLLGIDLGTKKTGLAYSDADGLIAFSYKTIEGKLEEQLKALIDLINDEGYEKVVIGLPSVSGEWQDTIKESAQIISKECNLDVYLQDEDFSTFKAKQSMMDIKSKLKKKDRKKFDITKDDAEAARIMLQTYIDKEN